MTNYTQEQTNHIVAEYISDPTMERVRELAEALGKTPKSVIGKLSREGVYKRSIYVSKTGAPPVTKIELVHTIAYNLGLNEEKLEGLEKAPKQVLFLLDKATAPGAGIE